MFNSKKDVQRAEDLATSTNIIGKGTSIQGDIDAEGSIRLEGTVTGNITTRAKLVLAADALLKGNIEAENVEIAGTVEGKIHATTVLILKSQAVIKGNIHIHQLIVEGGAQFNGKCYMRGASDELTMETPQEESVHVSSN